MHKKHKAGSGTCFISLTCLTPTFALFVLLVVTVPVFSQDMVRIPGGEFWMGRQHMWLIDELGMHLRLRLDDTPAHLTYVDDFEIDKYEVTNDKYLRFVETTKRRKPFHWIGGKVPAGKEQFPVYNVTWDGADAFCKWEGKKLPTAWWFREDNHVSMGRRTESGSTRCARWRRSACRQARPLWFSKWTRKSGIVPAERLRFI